MGTNFKIRSTVLLGVILLIYLPPDSLSARSNIYVPPHTFDCDTVLDQFGMSASAAKDVAEAPIEGPDGSGYVFVNVNAPCLLGDVNQDGVVSTLDVAPLLAIVASSGYQCEADLNQDGIVNSVDVTLFNNLLAGISTPCPCPACLLGDVNQDGVVNGMDTPFFLAIFSGGGYQCEADLNQDGIVDLVDATLFNNLLMGIPLPCNCLPGDVDRSGVVDFSDLLPFITLIANGGYQCEADLNDDGLVNFLDIADFISVLSGTPLPCRC